MNKQKNNLLSDSPLKMFKSTAAIVFLVAIAISLTVHIRTGNFYTPFHLGTFARHISFTIIVAFGQTLVLLLGGIDLSVAGVAVLCSMVFALLVTGTTLNPYFCMLIALALGFGVGALNGYFIHKLRASPFIATLATGGICTGIVYVVTMGRAILGIPASIAILGQGMLFGLIPYPAIIMLAIFIILKFVLKYTTYGRHIFAVGGNELATKIVGVQIGRVKVLTYALCGLLASVAGTLMVCRLASAQVNIGEGWVMPSITAVILGGTAMSGGSGGVGGTIVGGLLMGVISTSIILLGIPSHWETIAMGIVVLVAIAVDCIRRNKQSS